MTDMLARESAVGVEAADVTGAHRCIPPFPGCLGTLSHYVLPKREPLHGRSPVVKGAHIACTARTTGGGGARREP
ncbi:hypothetical protein MRX96_028221 [Rhipicephalus microplus]